MEAKRVFSLKIVILLFLFALIAAGIFLVEQNREWSEYCVKYTDADISIKQVYTKLNDSLNAWKNCDIAEMYEHFKEKRSEIDELQAECGETEEVLEWILFRSIFVRRYKYVSEYKESMEAIVNSDYMSLSIFAEPGSYSYHNILKTQDDYRHQVDIDVALVNPKAVEAVLECTTLNYIIVILLVLFVSELLKERMGGTWSLVYAAPGGRGKLALKRCGVLFLGAALIVFLVYVAVFVVSFVLYGGIESLTAPIHSSELFKGTSFLLSYGEFIIMYLIVHIIASFAVALLIWFVFGACRNRGVAIFTFGAIVVAEFILKEVVRIDSGVTWLKFINLFSLIEPGTCLIGYCNMAFMGYLTDKLAAFWGTLAGVLVVCAFACVFVGKCMKPAKQPGYAERFFSFIVTFIRRLTSHFGGIALEMYKSFILQKGLIFMAVLLYVACGQMETVGVTYTYFENEYNTYLESIDIVTGEGTEDFVKGIDAKIAENNERIRQLENNPAMQEVADSYRKLNQEKETLKQYINNRVSEKESISKERGIDIWILQDADYDAVLGKRGLRAQNIFAMCTAATVILLSFGVFSFDRQQNAEALIRSAKGGRGRAFVKRMLAVVFMTVVTSVIFYGIHFWNLCRVFNITHFKAPIQSLSAFRESPLKITIGAYFMLMYLYRTFLLIAVGFISAAISAYASYMASLFLSVLLLVPHGLSVLGIELFDVFSIITPIAYNKLYMNYGSGIQSFTGGIVLIVLGLMAAVAAWYKISGKPLRIGGIRNEA